MFDKYFEDPAPQLPRRLILDVSEPTQRFQEAVRPIEEFFGLVPELVISELLEHMTKQDEAILNIGLSSHEIANPEHPYDESLVQPVKLYTEARNVLGNQLFRTLQDFGLYYRGVLFFQHIGMVGEALVLEKLQLPITDAYRRNRSITRQAAAASYGVHHHAMETFGRAPAPEAVAHPQPILRAQGDRHAAIQLYRPKRVRVVPR